MSFIVNSYSFYDNFSKLPVVNIINSVCKLQFMYFNKLLLQHYIRLYDTIQRYTRLYDTIQEYTTLYDKQHNNIQGYTTL